MGAVVFDNLVFDSWLTKKSEEILYKVDREKITTEEMLILILKAQTNHFHHMDVEFREEFQKIHTRIDRLEIAMDERFGQFQTKIDDRFGQFQTKMDERFGQFQTKMDERFGQSQTKTDDRFGQFQTKIDDRFEKMWNFQKWQAGLIFAMFGGLYLKLFLG